MGGTRNIVGEFAEKLAELYYKADRTTASQKGYDLVKKDGSKEQKIQVKARRLDRIKATKLSVIRSDSSKKFEFDILLVLLFSEDGDILRAIEMDAETARDFARESRHVNGFLISTSGKFLNGDHVKDLTGRFKKLLKQV